MRKEILRMEGISKSFPGVKALKNVNFNLYEGEVLGLLGENGAGKSTLMKILSGVYVKDDGRIWVEGKEAKFTDVRRARDLNISIIHQELMIIPQMTVYENVFLGREIHNKLGMTDARAMEEKTQEMLDRYGIELHAAQLGATLTIAQKQMVEIIRAISFDAHIVVMDEPTSSLTDNEVQMLFDIIRKLKQEKVGIVYISHRLAELFEITDRITILRDGEYISTVNTAQTDASELVSLMVGRKLSNFFIKSEAQPGDVLLSVKGLSSPGLFEDVSFEVRRGEILGFSGLVGAGRSEVMKTIFGLLPKSSGEIFFEGQKVEIRRPQDAIRLGLGMVPESRRDDGLILGNTVGFNLTLSVLRKFIHAGYYNKGVERGIIEDSVEHLKIVTPSPQQRAGNLSGGNQQKIVVAKWLAANPKLLIMDEPTRGIDVGAKAEIYGIMDELAKSGVAIIMISSELPEVLNMSDRIVVMAAGRKAGELIQQEATQEKIMHLATGGSNSK